MFFLLSGCAGYLANSMPARRSFNRGDFLKAAQRYQSETEVSAADKLLYLLDTGMALHAAGEYAESNRYLLRADKLADGLDYFSISLQGVSLLATDYVLKYQGEEYEKVIINAYLALNYLLLGELEEARVEARRVDERIVKYEQQGRGSYNLNPFSRYISGLIYEIRREYNDAYIDYKRVAELMPGFEPVKRDLVRLSQRLGWREDIRPEDLARWGRNASTVADGELIIFFQAGLSPAKYQISQVIALPKYQPRSTEVAYAKIFVDGRYAGKTSVVEDIEATAIEQLKKKTARLFAKQALVAGGKIAIAQGLRREEPVLGDLLLLFFYATNKADLRSWLTLPRDIQIARIPLSNGKYTVTLKMYSSRGRWIETQNFPKIKISPRQRWAFINCRSVR